MQNPNLPTGSDGIERIYRFRGQFRGHSIMLVAALQPLYITHGPPPRALAPGKTIREKFTALD